MLPEFQLMGQEVPRIPTYGKKQYDGTHAFESVQFYWFQKSSKYDYATTCFCFFYSLRWFLKILCAQKGNIYILIGFRYTFSPRLQQATMQVKEHIPYWRSGYVQYIISSTTFFLFCESLCWFLRHVGDNEQRKNIYKGGQTHQAFCLRYWEESPLYFCACTKGIFLKKTITLCSF